MGRPIRIQFWVAVSVAPGPEDSEATGRGGKELRWEMRGERGHMDQRERLSQLVLEIPEELKGTAWSQTPGKAS